MLVDIKWAMIGLATWQTIYMVFIASFISIIVGTFIGIILYLTRPKGLHAHPYIYRLLGIIVNIGRSVPYIILMIAVIPLTQLIVGTSIGTNAAIVPLTLAAIPFYARIVEAALIELPTGLIEAGLSMGSTTRQLVVKFLLPEALPSLIKGATLTIIALVSYSAMAGAVAGGGLGQLAIDYGYQQFNIKIMVLTVIILVVLVQLVQFTGDWLTQKRNAKKLIGIVTLVCLLGIGVPYWINAGTATSYQKTLSVGIISGVQQRIMETAKKVALSHYNLHLHIVVFNDYNTPNIALNTGEIDANIFQHVPFLDAQIKTHGYHFSPIARTFIYPMGVFSKKIKTLSQLKAGDLVAVPNNPSEEGRALQLFAEQGLIQLKPGVELMGTVHDIIKNPYQLRFTIMNAAQIPRTLDNVTLAAINNDFLKPSGLKLSDALFHESADAPYANVIVVKTDNKNPLLQELVAVMHSEPVIKETETIFPDGSAIPAWAKP